MDRIVGPAVLAAVVLVVGATTAEPSVAAAELPLSGTPALACGPDDNPEPAQQGRVPSEVYEAGWTEPFTCNTRLLGHHGQTGGFKVLRYVDGDGRVCLYYDSTLVFPLDVDSQLDSGSGVLVIDATDPADPHLVRELTTPAMLSPHESLVLNQERGLLAAVLGTASTAPGVLDVYDVTEDCTDPQLQSSTLAGVLGHESGFAPDGNTFYASSLFSETMVAVDVTDPALPAIIYAGNHNTHGITISEDGRTAYLTPYTGIGSPAGPLDTLDGDATAGLQILDVSTIQDRELVPQPEVISELTWPSASIPQSAIPVTIDGTPYLVEIDEFVDFVDGSNYLTPDAGASEHVPGAGRIIDISDPTAPFVVSQLRLEVHDPVVRTSDGVLDDPGADRVYQGYAGHYCAVPHSDDPPVVACSMIQSGLRVFDITDPHEPVEIAYFNAPGTPGVPRLNPEGAPYAMSAPAIDPVTRTVAYSDTSSGLWIIEIDEQVWPGEGDGQAPRAAESTGPDEAPGGGSLAATGPAVTSVVALLLLGLAAASRRRR